MLHWLLLIVALVVPLGPASAQALALTEYDLDRGRRRVDGRTTPAIVDINSLVHIQLAKDTIRRRAAGLAGSSGGLDKLISRLEQLQRASARGLDALEQLQPAVDSLARNPRDSARQDAFRQAAQAVAGPLSEVDSLAPQGTALREVINTALERVAGASVIYSVQVAFQVAAEEAERIRNSVDSLLRSDGVSLLLGAWLWTNPEPRPIHLPGFDDYPPGDFVVVDRWSVALTVDQKTRLQTLTAQADDLRARNIDVAIAFRDGLRRSVQGIADSASACVTQLQSTLESARNAATGLLRDALSRGLDELGRTREAVVILTAAFGPGGAGLRDPISFVALAEQQVPLLLGGLRDLRATALDLATRLRASTLAARTTVADGLQACAASLEAGVSTLENDLGPITGMLMGTQRIDAASLEFGQEVLRLDLAAAPDDTRLDLKWTGARSEGDVVIVRLGLARRDDRPTAIEEHQLVLYRVLPHLRVAVDLIFADPVPGDLSAAIGGRFQPGASTSVLYTWGSRGWTGYNRFWRLGVGANFAALDLNRDGNPELGIGVALSALAERAQAGLGYDVGQDATYWFFALQLPFFNKALAVPGGGSGEASTP